MDETIEIKVTSEMAGKRLDVVLSEQCSDLTRSYINKLCKEERAALNGKTSKGNKKCKEGDVITLQVPEPTELEILPEEMNLDIVYEDQDVILINKPKGMVVHPAAGHYSGTLVNGLMAHCKDDLSGINGVLRPGIVHRIDKDTTGILIVCRNDMAHQSIAKQLYDHSITKKISCDRLWKYQGRRRDSQCTDRKKLKRPQEDGNRHGWKTCSDAL